MPGTLDDMIAIAALCQALVVKVNWLNQRDEILPMLSSHFIEENKWYVMRSGLNAEVVDFAQGQRLPIRQSIHELLNFVDDVLDDLGSRSEINYLRNLLDSSQGTGADRQIAIYQQTGNISDVIQFLMQQTMQGIPVSAT